MDYFSVLKLYSVWVIAYMILHDLSGLVVRGFARTLKHDNNPTVNRNPSQNIHIVASQILRRNPHENFVCLIDLHIVQQIICSLSALMLKYRLYLTRDVLIRSKSNINGFIDIITDERTNACAANTFFHFAVVANDIPNILIRACRYDRTSTPFFRKAIEIWLLRQEIL